MGANPCNPSLLPTTYECFHIQRVQVAQSCPTLCDPVDSSAHGILQTRILEWIAIPFSRGSSQARDQTQVSRTAGGFFLSEPPGKPLTYSLVTKNLRAEGSLRLQPPYFIFIAVHQPPQGAE